MKQSSLRFRLTVLAFASISLALIVTTYALNGRFYRYFEDRVQVEMDRNLEQLATNLSFDTAQNVVIAPLLDRRFQQPFSGLYWQVEIEKTAPIVSRSLWGKPIRISNNGQPGDRIQGTGTSPTGAPVLVSGWTIFVGDDGARKKVFLAIAIDESEVTDAAQGFGEFLIMWLGIMLAALIAASWVQISVGLAPLNLIKRKVELVKHGKASRLSGEFPSEVTPLVEEVNTLLDLHENSLAKARAKASDLAHGLKTPLTVMRVMLADIEGLIGAEKSRDIEEQIASIHNFIERELAQSRRAGGSEHESLVAPIVEKIVESMKKLPRGAELDWVIDIPQGLKMPLDAHDMTELFGNLLDNGRKWAENKVVIRVNAAVADPISISICDDGQGVDETELESLAVRGKRGPGREIGTGLGLAISDDLVREIGGTIVFSRSSLGGLRIDLSWNPLG